MEKHTVQNSNDYQAIIADWLGHTNYINGIISIGDMVEMFEHFHFGQAETQVILASMMACGAKFKQKIPERGYFLLIIFMLRYSGCIDKSEYKYFVFNFKIYTQSLRRMSYDFYDKIGCNILQI